MRVENEPGGIRQQDGARETADGDGHGRRMSNLCIVKVPGGYRILDRMTAERVNNSVYLTYAKAETAKRGIEAKGKEVNRA